MFLSLPYRSQPLSPTFGHPTARANFCEEDIVIVGFIAEFVNTCSNAAYSASLCSSSAGIHALIVLSVVIYATRALRRLPANAPLSAKSIYYGLGLVGLCSSLFHGLSSYHAQMADDTSMIVATSIVCHRVMTYRQSASFTSWFSVSLLLAVLAETAYHIIKDEQMVHELSFVFLIIVVAIKTQSLIKLRVHNTKDKEMLQKAVIFGAGCFVFGYLLWQLDFILCPQLTTLKRTIGLPWGFLLKLHGWWHILTAIGAHTFMIMVDRLTRENVEFASDDFGFFAAKNTTKEE